MNLPILFEDRMRRLLGEEYEEYLQCYSKPHFGGLRVNTLKISTKEFERICPFSIKRIPWVANGYYYNTKEQPARHPYYHAGLYYIQEPSAMTPASLLPIEKGDKVLDICAAPGGKSTELGAKLMGEGLLVTNDISNSRAKALLKNVELFGIRNALILSEAPNKLTEYFPEYFDKILIDAPCSGEGMFRKSPSIMKNWEQYGVDYYNKLQKEIILFAAKMLKPGGTMLYSTCTFSPEENEGTISYLMEQCPEFHVINAFPEASVREEFSLSYEGFDCGKPEWLQRISEPPSFSASKASEIALDPARREELKNCIRLWPHKINGEGHFIALLHKEDNNASPVKSTWSLPSKQIDQISKETYDFLDDVRLIKGGQASDNNIEGLHVHDNRVYKVPEGLPDLKGLRILRQGLLLGEMKKQRFEPAQALASALSTKEYDKVINIPSSESEAIRYLKCEAIEIDNIYEDGWQLVCVDGFPLGWGKTAKGSFKNKYLPGWRWM
ncbi:MAG TPA: RsmB/NOP family class I SAM-dependent RNA methyltransferase [Mobilitalea sp.]|nr:RsmB/NOP family class I SAM-dependent RNA methyltransferase [Mobilitalea sp.]